MRTSPGISKWLYVGAAGLAVYTLYALWKIRNVDMANMFSSETSKPAASKPTKPIDEGAHETK